MSKRQCLKCEQVKMAVMSVFILWIFGPCLHLVKGEVPQQFTVTEEGGSSQSYDCNSYVKQFTNIERVSYEQLRAVGVECLCYLSVPVSDNIADGTVVLLVEIEFAGTFQVTYGQFKSCQQQGGQMQFNVISSVAQTSLHVHCEVEHNVVLDSVGRDIPIVVTKSSKFTVAIGMECGSVSLLTTPEMPRALAVVDTTASLTNIQTSATGQKSADETIGLIVGISATVLTLIGVVAAFAVVKCRQTPTLQVPNEMQAHGNQVQENKATPPTEDTYLGLANNSAEGTVYTSLQVPRNADYENVQGVYVN